MRAARSFQGSLGIPHFVLCLAMSAGAAACSEAQGSGDTNLVVEVLQDEITLENKTGSSISKGELSIVPMGFERPYVSNISYLTVGAKRSFPLNSFRGSDGSPFRREVAKGKSVKVTARDSVGKSYEREVPFH